MKISLFLKSDKYLVLTDQILVSGSAFLTNLILAKALGVYEFGIFSGLGMIQLFLLSMNMSVGIQVFQVVFPSADDQLKKKLMNGFIWQHIFFSLVLLLVGFIFFQLVNIDGINFKTGFTSVVAISFFLLQDFLRKAMLTAGKSLQALVVDTITNISQLVILALCWYHGSLNQFIAWTVIGLTFLPSIILSLFFLEIQFPRFLYLKLAWEKQRPKIGWLSSSALLQWGAGYFFVLAAGWWLGAAALGALRLAQYVFGLLNVLLQAVENYVLPKAAMDKTGPEYFSKLTAKLFKILILPVLMLALLGGPILSLAGGDSFNEFGYVMTGLAVIYLFMIFGYPVRIAIRIHHLDRSYFIAYVFSVSFSLISAYWLIGRLGLWGVLIGMLMSQLISIGYWLYILESKKILSWKSFIWFSERPTRGV